MPTKRKRAARNMVLSAEAYAWIETTEADDFFAGKSSNGYGSVDRLPGHRPWWMPLNQVWRAHCAGNPLPEVDIRSAPRAIDFALALHSEWKRKRGGPRD